MCHTSAGQYASAACSRQTHKACDQARLSDALLAKKDELELLQWIAGGGEVGSWGWTLRVGHDARMGRRVNGR